MKSRTAIIVATALLMLSTAVPAASNDNDAKYNDSIWLPMNARLHNWRAVSQDEILIWSSPARPYLVRIWRPHRNIRTANAIGVTTTAGRLTTFDSIFVYGQYLPILSIERIDREVAKNMRYKKSKS